MPPLRIFIVDDSAVIRRLLGEVLSSEPGIEVAGTAGNGAVALSQVANIKPDLITLDVDMPVMDGLETVAELRKLYPRLPVIMFSRLTERGATATLDALARGASDYVSKPSGAGSLDLARERVRAELVPKIRVLCARGRAVPQPRPAVAVAPSQQARIDIVAIGSSTGGPNALVELIPGIPESFPVPIVIVQHMPPLFTRLMAERMRSQANLAVREGEDGARVEGGQVWIAPGGHHMAVVRKGPHALLALTEDPPENSCRPAVDVLFRSVAQAFGAHVLAVVLTGMGSDGTRGAKTIRDAGGEVFIQDQASSVVWGMPGSVAAAGLANNICPLDRMAAEITGRVMLRRGSRNEVMSAGTR